MNDLNAHNVLVIVGPTAVGKTEISIKTAEIIKGEVVSADSRQLYRYMDIGTAKPSTEELNRVPHHFIGYCNPDQYFSAGEYAREARACIQDIQNRGKYALVTGGAGFYIQALVDGLFAPAHSDRQIKEKWQQKIQKQGRKQVFESLKHIDPETAAKLHPNDTQRIVRALEVYELTGTPISAYRNQTADPAEFKAIFIGLHRKRENLYARIEKRIDCMLEQGLVDEVSRLKEMGYTSDMNALCTVGYKEVFDYLENKFSYEQMVEKIKINSRRYAKRQMTWFRKDKRIEWIELDEIPIADAIQMILNRLHHWKG